MREIAAIISGLLILLAAPPYIINTIRGKTKPERVTWLIFSVLESIAFVSQIILGGSWSLVFIGLDLAASLTVLALSIKYGVGGHTKLDIAALVVAGVGVTISLLAKQPLISIFGVILADVSGVVVTVKKTFLNPSSETTISWLLVGTAAIFGVLSVGKVSFDLLIYPIYLVLANYIVPITQLVGYKVKGKPT